MVSFSMGSKSKNNIIDIQSSTNVLSEKEKAVANLKKGNLVGSCLSIILEGIDRFNLFNKSNDFEIRLGPPDIRFYRNDTIIPSSDMRYIIGISKKGKEMKFTQIFFPYKAIYVILDHILGGEGNGEYDREFSKIDLAILRWYFNFLDYYKEKDEFFEYYVYEDFRKQEAYPINPLFKIHNIILGYVPLLIYDNVFSEVVVRINFDALKNIMEKDYKTSKKEEYDKEKISLFTLNRMATDDELDEIVQKIIRQ